MLLERDMQRVREKGFTAFKAGDLKLKDLELLMEFENKVILMKSRTLTSDQRDCGYARIFRDLSDYSINMSSVKDGIRYLDSMYKNSLWENWPIFGENFKYENFLKCKQSIAPQWIDKKGLYLFTTEKGFKVPVLYDREDFSIVVMANFVDGALCALPNEGKKYLQFVNRKEDRIVGMELIKSIPEIEDMGLRLYREIFGLVCDDPSIYDPRVCYYKERSPKYIRIDCHYMPGGALVEGRSRL